MKPNQTTHPTFNKCPSAHVVALRLEEVEEQGDAVLGWGDQLPDAVLVGRILLGPAGAGDGAVQLGDVTSTGGWNPQNKQT